MMVSRRSAFLRISVPQNVERLPAQLAHNLGQAIQVRETRHAQVLGWRQRLVLDQGAGHVGLNELLQRVLGVSGVVQIRDAPSAPRLAPRQGGWLRAQLLLHGRIVVPVHGADGQRARTRQLPRLEPALRRGWRCDGRSPCGSSRQCSSTLCMLRLVGDQLLGSSGG